jgi:RNA polymerase sigma factor (sigma-70 family)
MGRALDLRCFAHMPTTTHPRSFDDVCLNYSCAMLRIIRHYIKNPNLEKDVHQEVLLKLWRKWPTYDQQKGSLFTWITVITTTTCIDHLRKVHGKVLLGEQGRGLGEAERKMAETDLFNIRCELFRLTARLSANQRDVVKVIYFKGLTQDEAARLLHLPLGTVKSRQRAAILALRKMYCG